MRDRPVALAFIAGLACLPATYTLLRKAEVIVSLLVMAAIGAASAVVAWVLLPASIGPRLLPMLLMFVVGALVSPKWPGSRTTTSPPVTKISS
jgi:hypothetical protein